MARHPLHSICPYFAMFPEGFVEEQILLHTHVGDTVFDPFSGRGTTVFQSLLMDREAFGTDINPVAACISGAKADPPELVSVLNRLSSLADEQPNSDVVSPSPFFDACFHPDTLSQVLYLRTKLDWKSDRVDRFIAAMCLGALHGESHKSPNYFSNRMPRTISTKPEYSVRWWEKNGYTAPKRDAFTILRDLAKFRLGAPLPPRRGKVALQDARLSGQVFLRKSNSVKLIVTSPPYVDVTDYAEDQWLRLWFLGGESRPKTRTYSDDRHTHADRYWSFLTDVWNGMQPLLNEKLVIVIRIGGPLEKEDLARGLLTSLQEGLSGFEVEMTGDGATSPLKRRQTNTFRPGTANGVEHDFKFSIRRAASH
jgi:hypothetical protein